MKKALPTLALLAFFLSFLFLDFYTKAKAFYFLDSEFSFAILQKQSLAHFLGFDLSLALVLNKGAAWGIFSKFHPFLVMLRIGVIASLIVYLFFFVKNYRHAFFFVLMITGAIGNVIDTFVYGSVVDFLSVSFKGHDFPVFNIADMLIFFGVILMALEYTVTKLKKKPVHDNNI